MKHTIYSLFQKKRNISEVAFLLEKSVYEWIWGYASFWQCRFLMTPGYMTLTLGPRQNPWRKVVFLLEKTVACRPISFFFSFFSFIFFLGNNKLCISIIDTHSLKDERYNVRWTGKYCNSASPVYCFLIKSKSFSHEINFWSDHILLTILSHTATNCVSLWLIHYFERCNFLWIGKYCTSESPVYCFLIKFRICRCQNLHMKLIDF